MSKIRQYLHDAYSGATKGVMPLFFSQYIQLIHTHHDQNVVRGFREKKKAANSLTLHFCSITVI